jgi:predicted MFS family arabinose efflux permease
MGLYSIFLGLGQLIGASIGGPFVDWQGADGIVIVTALLGTFAGLLLLRLHFAESRGATSKLSPTEQKASSLFQE